MIYLPTPDGYPHVITTVTLSQVVYGIRWLWNERDRAFVFDMDDASGQPLVAGVRVVLGADLIAWAPVDRGPPYPIVVLDPTGGTAEPTLETLGRRIKVVYTEPDDE
jgi:hypothetical protein